MPVLLKVAQELIITAPLPISIPEVVHLLQATKTKRHVQPAMTVTVVESAPTVMGMGVTRIPMVERFRTVQDATAQGSARLVTEEGILLHTEYNIAPITLSLFVCSHSCLVGGFGAGTRLSLGQFLLPPDRRNVSACPAPVSTKKIRTFSAMFHKKGIKGKYKSLLTAPSFVK